MKTWWLVCFAVLCLAVVGCVTRQETCAPTCAGCCDSVGRCLAGTDHAACGSAGAACSACNVMHASCRQQACIPEVDGGGAGGGSGSGTGGGGGTDAGVDAGAPLDAGTYPDGGNPHRYWDGGACTVATDCPCFSSDDCGPGFFCQAQDTTGMNIFCVPGARGSGRAGAVCAGESDCLSALCTDSVSTGMRCSELCDLAAECPATLPRCLSIGFGVDRSICAP